MKAKAKKWPLVYVFVCVELAFCTICTKLRGSLSFARQTTRTQALLHKHVYSRLQCVYVHDDYVSMRLWVHVQYTMKKKLTLSHARSGSVLILVQIPLKKILFWNKSAVINKKTLAFSQYGEGFRRHIVIDCLWVTLLHKTPALLYFLHAWK